MSDTDKLIEGVVSELGDKWRKAHKIEGYKGTDVIYTLASVLDAIGPFLRTSLRSLVTEAERIGEARAWKEAEGCVPDEIEWIPRTKSEEYKKVLLNNARASTLAAMKARQQQ